MSDIYLHIGSPKTATTYLQSFLNLNRKQLLEDGLIIPDFLGDKNMRYFPFIFAPQTDQRFQKLIGVHGDSTKLENIRSNIFENLEIFFRNLNGKSVVISSEHLFKLRISKIKEIKEYLESYFDNIRIICYLREPISFSISSWSTSMKGGNNSKNVFDPAFFPNADQTKEVLAWQNVYGNDLRIRHFQKESLINTNIIDDFLNQTGIKYDSGKYLTPERCNASLSYDSLVLLYCLNNAIPFFVDGKRNKRHEIISREIISVYGRGEKFLPSKGEIEHFEDYFQSYRNFLSNIFEIKQSHLTKGINVRAENNYYTGNLEIDINNIAKSKARYLSEILAIKKDSGLSELTRSE